MNPRCILAGALVLGALTVAAPSAAQTSSAPAPAPTATPAPAAAPATSAGNEALDQRLRILERKLELAEEAAAEKTKTAAGATAGADGFALKSADGAFQLKLRGLLQTDGRFYSGDQVHPVSDTLVIRRARPILEGTLFQYVDFRLMPDFGGGTGTLLDAYLDLKLAPAFRLRAGKAKVPVGLEALLNDQDLPFVERGLPASFAPVRDVGVQLLGEPFAGKLTWTAGVFDGALDGASSDTASADAKEYAGRLFFRPFVQPAGQAPAALDLGFGLAASDAHFSATTAAPQLPSYKTAGQQTIFGYRSDGTAAGTVFADGDRRRIAPQGWLYSGPLYLLAEWTRSEQEVTRGLAHASLRHTAWQAVGSWCLTGERVTERGVVPRRPFAPGKGGAGAWILSFRLGEATFDSQAFPLFADPAKSVRRATNAGASLSWNLNRAVRLLVDYERTRFDGGEKVGDREPEKVLLARVQLAF